MLFNSYEFIFVFLPIVLIVYFLLNKQKLIIASKSWMVLASLAFYSWWNIKYLPLILMSIIFNFAVGTSLNKIGTNSRKKRVSRKSILIFSIVANLSLLAYYKYTDFFILNYNTLTGADIPLQNIVLPLGISFFTFTQIAYLVDAYKEEVKEMDYLNYSLFVTFFPHLIAGPILHHSEMMPQFDSLRAKILNYKNISRGIFLFSIGLFKKVFIADTFAVWANSGFNHVHSLTFVDAWVTSLSYAMQLYFDFSGYTDMALGAALMFNIMLPINFNSPYKALNIQDFWRRWHITLSRFLRDYIYIPLGGNRKSEFRTYSNLLLTFLIGGLWHGASWTFVLWGFMHGAALVIHRAWQRLNIKMNKYLAWFITFNFVNFSWIFFRAKTFDDAITIIQAMLGIKGLVLFGFLESKLGFLSSYGVKFGSALLNVNGDNFTILYVIFIWIIVFQKNSIQMLKEFKPTTKSLVFAIIITIIALVNLNKISEFLYFQF